MLQVSSSRDSHTHAGRPLRIAFLDCSGWDFHVLTPDAAPLGGSQSAACYLARALAAQGHPVFFFTAISAPGIYANVQCLSLAGLTQAALAALKPDVCVCILAAGTGARLRQLLGPAVRLVLWTQHASDQPGVETLRDPAEQAAYDAFALVSAWQSAGFQTAFGIPPQRIAILRNAAAPAFLDLFPPPAPILERKTTPPVLAYTSTPFRGLSLLLDAFPRIRAAIPGTTLRVYSDMRVYRTAPDQEQAEYGALYERCRQTPGVDYIGSLAQPQLAQALRDVSLLAYPNIFAETSCIAVLEAMAAGCRIVTSRFGALPETTAGFADLVDMPVRDNGYLKEDDYLNLFVAAVVGALNQMQSDPAAVEARLRKQVSFMNDAYNWPLRARQWADWLR